MTFELSALIILAISMGFFHTLMGPDHYLPFIVMSKSRKWSLIKTSWITFLCGLGHVASSVVLGFVGIALGIGVSKLEGIESVRGDIAAWLFITFGLVYFVWGVRKAIKNKPHTHLHFHTHEKHEHEHTHHDEHAHVHTQENKKSLTPWVLFLIFAFGPCEPLIPILMYPAAKGNFFGVILVASTFAIFTIGTMLTIVLLGSFGINFLPMKKIERYTHAIAGGTIALCGFGIVFLGL